MSSFLEDFLDDLGNYVDAFFDPIIKILHDIGDALIKAFRWIFIKVINFSANIYQYFLSNADKHRNDRNVVGIGYLIEKEMKAGNATVIKGILKNSDAEGALVKGFYNKETKTLYTEDMEVNEFSQLDQETKNQYGNNKLLIIE